MADQLEPLAIAVGNENRVKRFARAAPLGAVFEHKLLARRGDFVLQRQPCHTENENAPVRLQHPEKLGHKLFVVKIKEALARRDHVKRTVGKIDLFGRHDMVIDIHSFGQEDGLSDLILGDIRSDPFCAVWIQISREYARSGGEVKNGLADGAQTAVKDFTVKFGRIDVAESGVIGGSPSPVERRSAVYV